jgi:cell shape-determining protein MreC
VKFVVIDAFPERVSEEILDMILIKQGLNPGVHVGSIVVAGKYVLRERNEFIPI